MDRKKFITGLMALGAVPAAAGGTVPIHAGFSGVWTDASGQIGLSLNLLDADRMAATAYLFAPAGGQAWIGGVGPIVDGSRATIGMTTIDGPGGRFGANFDPARVQNTAWGTLTLRFADCGAGTLDWTSDVPGYGSGSTPIQRITLPAGLGCL